MYTHVHTRANGARVRSHFTCKNVDTPDGSNKLEALQLAVPWFWFRDWAAFEHPLPRFWVADRLFDEVVNLLLDLGGHPIFKRFASSTLSHLAHPR